MPGVIHYEQEKKLIMRLPIFILLLIISSSYSEEINQGIKFENEDDDVEVFINDSSYGKPGSTIYELPVGKYKIAGKRTMEFEDYEMTRVSKGRISTVSLGPKPIKLQIIPQILPVATFDGENIPSIGAEFSLLFRKNNVGIFGSHGLSENLGFAGVMYNWMPVFTKNVGVYIGLNVSYFHYYPLAPDYIATTYYPDIEGLLVGPNLKFTLGYDHFFLEILSKTYFFFEFSQILGLGICLMF
jgi:hypothetical protein